MLHARRRRRSAAGCSKMKLQLTGERVAASPLLLAGFDPFDYSLYLLGMETLVLVSRV